MKHLLLIILILIVTPVFAQSSDDADKLQQLLDEVSNNIHFSPYKGNLRNPGFVEQSQQANAFDRSILLLERVKKAGYRAHLAHGELSVKHKKTLVNQIIKENNIETTASDANDLYSLKSEAIADLLSQHFWVEVIYNNQLTAMDASFNNSKFGDLYASKKGVVSALSPYQHTVKIEHKLKNQSGSIVKLGSYSTTTALLGLEPISLMTKAKPIMAEVGRKTSPFGGISGIAGGISGRKQEPQGDNLSVVGETYHTTLTVEGTSRRFGLYQSTFNIPGAAIEREWLEISLTYPDEAPKVIERELFFAKSDKQLPDDYRHVVISVLPGEIVPSIANQLANKIKAALPSKAVFDKPSDSLTEVEVTNSSIGHQSGLLFNIQLASASDQLTRKMASRNSVVAVYDQPRIYITTVAGNQDESGNNKRYSVTFDYRVDDISVYSLSKDNAPLNYFFQMARGLQQATLEGLLVDRLNEKNDGNSVTQLMLKANEQRIEKTVITPANLKELDNISGLGSSSRAYLNRALASGHHIIIPQKAVMVEAKSHWAWWQVDPLTGNTVGVLGNGLHGAMAEYNILQRKVTVNSQQGFVIGMITGANSAHLMLITHMIAGNPIDEKMVSSIESRLTSLACSSCFNPGADINVSISATANVGCFELFKLTLFDYSKGISGPFSFCGGYSAGFNCAVKMVLGRIDNSLTINDSSSASAGVNLSCPNP